MNEINTHTHDGINSHKIQSYNIIPTYTMTSAQLAKYISRNSIEGSEFNVFDGTNYRKYIRVNQIWKYLSLT